MHLGMSGQVLIRKTGVPPEPYLRAIFHLESATEIRFVDSRKFGELFLKLPSSKDFPLNLSQLGPEPLGESFTLTYFTGVIRKSRRNIKTLLMDQKAVAGIGNIYSDEILFRAKIHPERIASALEEKEIKLLHRTIRKTLREAIINRGTTASDGRYLNGTGRMGKFQTKLKVYQRQGDPCYKCGTIIKSVRIGGRSASFCPQCQK
jgi:formamidopyrimidine-DNA glycosylase